MFSGLNIGDVLQTVFEKLWRLSGFEMTEVVFKTDHLINSTWTDSSLESRLKLQGNGRISRQIYVIRETTAILVTHECNAKSDPTGVQIERRI